jgi:hypothetical protein
VLYHVYDFTENGLCVVSTGLVWSGLQYALLAVDLYSGGGVSFVDGAKKNFFQ